MATVRPDQAGLDSHVDPGDASMGGSVAGVKAITTMLVVAVLNISLKLWTTHAFYPAGGSLIAHNLCLRVRFDLPGRETGSRRCLKCRRGSVF